MSLNERLKRSQNEREIKAADEKAKEEAEIKLQELKDKLHRRLVSELGHKINLATSRHDQMHAMVIEALKGYLQEEDTPLSADDKEQLIREVLEDALGYGPIEEFLDDPDITEVMVNGPKRIYIEREGRIYSTEKEFLDEDHLRRIIDKIVSEVGRRIDESSPMVDARLPDGSRVNAIIPPLSLTGPTLTVRKFSREPYTDKDLVNFGTLTTGIVDLLERCVRGKLNLIVSGGTGSGKTTLLNVLSASLPGDERIVTIEDAAELRLTQDHVIRLESRPPNIEGRGQITIRDLVRNSLRMRPDRIIVGEVRGGEALDMLQAMNTGHNGSISTVHANSPRDTLSRMETMVLMAGMDLPVRAIREQIASALDMIIHLSRLPDGSRRVTQITEVLSMEGDIITLQDLFLFDYSAGRDEAGRFLGTIKPTGIRPKFVAKLHDVGIEVPIGIFGIPEL